MADVYKAAMEGGLKAILDEALASVSSSAQIFVNAPEGTRIVRITIRVATLVMTFDGSAASTTNGHDYAVSTYDFALDQANALLVRAIQNGGTATGHITYLGRP